MNTETWIVIFSVLACISGLIFAAYNYLLVARIKMRKKRREGPRKKKNELLGTEKIVDQDRTLAEMDYDKLVRSGELISSAAMVYLLKEYGVLGTFIIGFGLLIYVYFLITCIIRSLLKSHYRHFG